MKGHFTMHTYMIKMDVFNGFRNEKKPTGSNIESAGQGTPAN